MLVRHLFRVRERGAMFSINKYSHIPLLTRELEKLLPAGSFASRLRQAIAREWDYRLREWPVESEIEYSSLFPVDALFVEVTEHGGLDPEWLQSEDGSYLDDDGELIPSDVNPSYSAVEQLAAYGLWLISENEMDCYGAIAEQGINNHGYDRDDVIEHRAESMLLAYQALTYSQKIMLGTPPSIEEIEKAKKLFLSESGKAGSDKRHAPMRILKDWTLNQYQSGSWPSANKASHDLKEKVLAHGRTIGAHLSIENAQRTIAEWIRKSA